MKNMITKESVKMKICITSQGNDRNAEVDPRFGRCQYFVIADTDTDQVDIIDNTNKDGMGGVGIQAGQMMAEKDIKAVLTGNVGPNAFQTLNASGVEVITGVTGKVSEAIEKYKSGGYTPSSGASVDPHFGTRGGAQ